MMLLLRLFIFVLIVVIIFTRYSIQNYVDIYSKSDNTDENIMNIMMLMLNHVCGTIMILLIIIRLILFIAKTISKGDFLRGTSNFCGMFFLTSKS